ncbi:MAG: ABC transporter permease [Sphingobacteriaceae bacterium]|nr:MAG: ABC transporter permease [Sphingobacteriaceae bacterium]
MLKNYLKIAYRNLWKNKAYSAINILGLTVGLTACLLVATVVIDDLSYDRQWKNAKNIYRIISVDNSNKLTENRFSSSFSGLGPSLKNDFPEVVDYCRMSAYKERIKMGTDKDGVEIATLSAEPTVWNVLDFDVVQGNPKKFVKGYVNLVITEKIRNQYFPNSNPIGKVVYNLPDFGKTKALLITGIIKNISSNTHFRSDILLIDEVPAELNKLSTEQNGSFTKQYLLLKPQTSIPLFKKKVNNWYKNIIAGTKTLNYDFQPVKDIYLRSDFDESQEVKGNIRDVYIFSAVAILLLVIACINFINLTTARAIKRVREVGIRKVLGADKKELIAQFLFESLLFFVISFVLSIFLYNFFIQPLEAYLGHSLTLNLLHNFTLFSLTTFVVLIVSLFTGLYPAWLVSQPKAVVILKGKLSVNTNSDWLRKSLVVVQFTISIVILIATIVVQTQLNFISKKDLGFDKNNLISIYFTNFGTKGGTFKQEILKIPGVESVSIENWVPSYGGADMTLFVDDPDQKGNKVMVNFINGDVDLAKTLKLKLENGRFLSTDFAADALNIDSLLEHDGDKLKKLSQTQSYITTAYTAKLFGIKNLNKPVKNIPGIPVGIVKDFHNESLHANLKPCFIQATSNLNYGSVLIRIKPNLQKQVLAAIDKQWQQFFPDKILKIEWISDLLDSQYRREHKLQQLFTFFSLLIVFLACLGLFGLATFTAEQRTKEIGIRKVLGASVAQITALLSKDFVVLVILALVIASPVAFFTMQKWLQDFAYRINIQWWMFALAGMLAVLIALFTISFQSIKTALANPVKSLRSE